MISPNLDWPTTVMAKPPACVRCAVDVLVANLSVEERDVLNSLIATLSDPGLAGLRRDFMAGRVALAIEDGIPTWSRHSIPGGAQ